MDNSSPKIYTEFLPISRADMEARGWDQLDFVVVGGDAYVDHPSFGTAIISRLLEAEGYKVGVLAQPRYTDCEDFKRFGKPKYGFFIGGGNVDSMVSHYSVAKIPRAEDEYSPGGKGGARPDRSATVYTRLAKQAYPDLPVILGGLEASLRRFAHYDYWLDTVLPSIAEDSGADIISFGMGEHQTVEIARRLAAGEPVESITDVDGTCYMTDFDHLPERYVECAGFKKVASDKTAYAKACRIQMDNQDVVSGQIIVQKQSEKYLVQNIPAKPLVRGELDKVYALPYTRRYHPIYESMGDGKVGVITASVAYEYAKEVFPEGTSFLKLGLTFPLPMDLIRDFASRVEKLYVIEELEPFMEDQIKAAGIPCVGKELTGLLYELNTQLLRERVLGEKTDFRKTDVTPASRPPALCPGCPHRGFFYTLSKNKNYVVTGDIGCYTLGSAAPLNCMDSVVCMGAGFSAGMGIAKSFEREGVSDKTIFGVMGDSTFFHSGMTGAAEIIYNNGRMIPCVLDNRITGMTGHQDNPRHGLYPAGGRGPHAQRGENFHGHGLCPGADGGPAGPDGYEGDGGPGRGGAGAGRASRHRHPEALPAHQAG